MVKKSLMASSMCFFMIMTHSFLAARDLRIVTPYLGIIRDRYQDSDYNLDLEDSSLMKGLYLQWINTEKFQTNVFLYQSSDINYSGLWGFHFIFDYYYDVSDKNKNVAGVGLDYIGLDMDAGNNLTPLSDFKLRNNVYVPYVRLGRYFLFGTKNVQFSFLPWLGAEVEFVRGNISFVPPGPPVEEEIDSEYVFSLAGVNLKTAVFHFIEVESKYTARFNTDDYLSDVSVLVNLYLSRHWAASYRFKYMESISGWDRYHIWGAAYVF